jgi:hypothetical protein
MGRYMGAKEGLCNKASPPLAVKSKLQNFSSITKQSHMMQKMNAYAPLAPLPALTPALSQREREKYSPAG